MGSKEKYCLSWKSHEDFRTSKLKSLLENKSFLDVTIACGDDEQIDAHKLVLSVASPIFERLFERNPRLHPLIYLSGVKKNIVESLLHFIYTGKAKVAQGELNEFLALSESLKIQGLFEEDLTTKINENTSQGTDTPIHPPNTHENSDIEYTIEDQTMRLTESGTNNEEGFITIDESHSHEIDIQGKEIKEESTEVECKVFLKEIFDDKSVMTVDDYDVMIDTMLYRNGTTWNCAKCVYTSSYRGHVREHVESHCTNVSIGCSFCGADFGRKRVYRMHLKMCHNC